MVKVVNPPGYRKGKGVTYMESRGVVVHVSGFVGYGGAFFNEAGELHGDEALGGADLFGGEGGEFSEGGEGEVVAGVVEGADEAGHVGAAGFGGEVGEDAPESGGGRGLAFGEVEGQFEVADADAVDGDGAVVAPALDVANARGAVGRGNGDGRGGDGGGGNGFGDGGHVFGVGGKFSGGEGLYQIRRTREKFTPYSSRRSSGGTRV